MEILERKGFSRLLRILTATPALREFAPRPKTRMGILVNAENGLRRDNIEAL